jgi:exodeoxyribonuclease-3
MRFFAFPTILTEINPPLLAANKFWLESKRHKELNRPVQEPLKMKIATWNINSVRLRLETVLAFLQQADIDVLCLQETKTVN